MDAQLLKTLFTTLSRQETERKLLPTVNFTIVSFKKSGLIGAMASKLQMLLSKAGEASKILSKHGNTYYKQALEQNKKYIIDPPTVEKCQELSNQLLYTRLASIPSRYNAFWKEADQVKQLLKTRKEFKNEDMGVAALFGLECFAWFWAGQVVGRGFTITGYYV